MHRDGASFLGGPGRVNVDSTPLPIALPPLWAPYSSKKARICANLMGGLVGVWEVRIPGPSARCRLCLCAHVTTPIE